MYTSAREGSTHLHNLHFAYTQDLLERQSSLYLRILESSLLRTLCVCALQSIPIYFVLSVTTQNNGTKNLSNINMIIHQAVLYAVTVLPVPRGNVAGQWQSNYLVSGTKSGVLLAQVFKQLYPLTAV